MTIVADSSPLKADAGKGLRVGIWVGQLLLALLFIGIGAMKLTSPIADLAVNVKWAADYSPTFVRTMGLIDLLGGFGVLLPSLTRILPRVTVFAAGGCTLLQLIAIGFHLSRNEANVLPLNFVLISLSVFVLWGRALKAPIQART